MIVLVAYGIEEARMVVDLSRKIGAKSGIIKVIPSKSKKTMNIIVNKSDFGSFFLSPFAMNILIFLTIKRFKITFYGRIDF